MDVRANLFVNFKNCAKENINRTAIYFQDKSITYGEFLQKIYRVSAFFQSIHLKKDDLITLVAPNTPESVACFYAASMLDLKIHLLHPLTNEKILIRELKEKQSKLFICVSLFLNNYPNILKMNIPIFVLNPASSLNFIKRFAFSRINKKDLKTYFKDKKIYKYDDYKTTNDKFKDYNPLKGRIYLSSGGTTSMPKTIVLSDFALCSLIKKVDTILNIPLEEIKTKSMVAALPMFHGFGLVMGILAVLNYGGKVSLLAKFNTNPVIKLIKQNRANYIIGVPLMFEALLKNPNFANENLKNIDTCFIGGDFISPSLLQRFNECLKNNGSKGLLLEGYGLTETVTVLSVNTLKEHRKGSVGKPLKGIEVIILDEKNNILPYHVKGEIAVAGDTLMEGYLEDENPFIFIKNKKYVKTGDIGYLDEDNYLYFISRKKRVIKKRGFNIFPLGIEKLVSSLPYISECAYLSKNNGKEEITYLFVVPNDKTFDKKEIENKLLLELKSNIQSYEIPDHIILEEKFQLTNVGKIDYVALSKKIK